MARNKQSSQRTAQATADGYENFVARVGMQTPNQHSASTYRANFTSRNRMLVEWSYRGSWVIGEAVDAIPDDMTRKGIRITSEIDAKDRGTLEAQLDELQIWDALNDVLKWSRLYGGAVGYLDFTGNLDTCIGIRLVYKKNGKICVQSGAGIVADSVPEKEYQECCNKAKAVVQAVLTAQEGLE